MDEFKKIFLAGVGAVASSAEKSKEILDELVKKGELTVEQGKVLNEELKRDMTQKVNDAVSVAESVSKIANRVHEMTPEERAMLLKSLEEADVASKDATEETSEVQSDEE